MNLKIAAALFAVYVIWGSTFLAIRFAIETIPPLTMAGFRFTVAGAVLYLATRVRGVPRPEPRHWLAAGVVGMLLLAGGNGGVSWSQQYLASGTAALFMASVPAWMVLFDWLRPGGRVPGRRELAGVSLGMVGIVLLVQSTWGIGLNGGALVPTLVLAAAPVSWALGSIVARSLDVPASALQLTAMQMLVGGAGLLLMGGGMGEWGRVDPAAMSLASLTALAYLIVFGSWLGYSAYVWLLKESTAAVASSYAFVNPAIAVALGWAVADEEVGAATLGAMAVIVVGVALIILKERGKGEKAEAPARAYPGGVVDGAEEGDEGGR